MRNFTDMHPDKIDIGTLVINSILPNTIFTVSQIIYRETDFDGKRFVVGYLTSDKLSKVSFAHKEGNTQYTFFTQQNNMLSEAV